MTGADDSPPRVPDSELEFGEDLVVHHQGIPFTGIAYEERDDLGLCEIRYRDGLQDGLAQDRYCSGVVRGESWFTQDVRHGPEREFDTHGTMSAERFFEYGVLTASRQWDENGVETASHRLDVHSPNHAILTRGRRDRNWSVPE